jgi:hypothetical protein
VARGMQVWTSESVPVCIFVPGVRGEPLVGKKKDNRQIELW